MMMGQLKMNSVMNPYIQNLSNAKLSSLNIIDPSRTYVDPSDYFETLNSWSDMFAISKIDFGKDYYLIKETKPWCGWNHIGNTHQSEGRYLWNFMNYHPKVCFFKLQDAPDFQGVFKDNKRFYGDIGNVSATAFLDGILCLRKGDCWITVDGSSHTVLEAQCNVGEILMDYSLCS